MSISRRSYFALVGASLLAAFLYSQVLVVSPISDLLRTAYRLSFSEMALLFSLPLLMYAILALPGGYLSDRIGVRPAATLGIVVASGAGLLRGFTDSLQVLTILTAVVGVGLGMAAPNLPKVVSLFFPGRLAGTATGIYAIGLLLGVGVVIYSTVPLIMPLTGGVRGPFYFWGTGGLIAAILWWILVAPPAAAGGSSLGMHSRVLRSKHVWLASWYFFLAGNAGFYSIAGLFPSFLTSKGMTLAEANSIVSLLPVFGVAAVFLIPWLSDKMRRRRPFILGPCALSAVIFGLTVIAPASAQWVLMPIQGFALTACFVMGLVLPVELAEEGTVGTASGLVLSIGYAGALFGPVVAGLLWDLSGTFTLSLVMLILVMLVSMGIILMIPETGGLRFKRRFGTE